MIANLCAQVPGSFFITRIHYGGGGDWYSDPSSLPNLIDYLRTNTAIINASKEVRIKLTDNNAKQYPYLYMTGHGNIRFSENEIIELRSILNNGGFLHADDNYGMDKSFRREIKKVYPNKEFVELPHTHPIFFSFYDALNSIDPDYLTTVTSVDYKGDMTTLCALGAP